MPRAQQQTRIVVSIDGEEHVRISNREMHNTSEGMCYPTGRIAFTCSECRVLWPCFAARTAIVGTYV